MAGIKTMEIKKSNPYAAITVLILCAILFMGYWAFVPIYATIYNIFDDDSALTSYTTQVACEDRGYYWAYGACSQLPERAENVIVQQRIAWLTAPFIFVFGLILWYWSKATNKDYQGYQGP